MGLEKDSTIEIPVSKGKTILMIFGAACFVLIGVYFIMPVFAHPNDVGVGMYFAILGIVSIVFFGACGLVGIWKLFDRKPGLVINSEGIVDNSSGIPLGLIPWNEIAEFIVLPVGQYTKLLTIHLFEPDKYIESGNRMQVMAKRASYSMYETPFTISSNALAISFDKLHALLEERLAMYREDATPAVDTPPTGAV